MIYHRTALFLACLIHAGISATSTVPTGDQSLFWRITAPSGVVSHIFGTIHLADTTVFRQRDTVLQILGTSSSFAAEMNLDSVFRQMRPEALMIPSGSLYDVYDSADVRLICATLEAINPLLGRACERMKPGAVMMIASMSAFERTAPTSIDEFLWARARSKRLVRHGLESLAEQIALIDSMPASFVMEQIRGLDSSKVQSIKLRDHYAREELDSLQQEGDESDAFPPQMMAMLNDRRNIRMVERMIPLLNDGNAFVAIGALHLTGPSSVLALLRQRGYVIDPVVGGNRVNWLDRDTPGKR